jgi:hypothetical protein
MRSSALGLGDEAAWGTPEEAGMAEWAEGFNREAWGGEDAFLRVGVRVVEE